MNKTDKKHVDGGLYRDSDGCLYYHNAQTGWVRTSLASKAVRCDLACALARRYRRKTFQLEGRTIYV